MADTDKQQDQGEFGQEQSGPYAEAHPDRPNSGEAPNEQKVTEQDLEAAEFKRGYGARGAAPQGPVTDLTIADTVGVDQDEDRLAQLDEEIDNETDSVKRAIKSAERDNVANRVYKLRADKERADARESGRDEDNEVRGTVDDPGDARGQRSEEARKGEATQESGARLSDEGQEKGSFNDVDTDVGVEKSRKGRKGKS